MVPVRVKSLRTCNTSPDDSVPRSWAVVVGTAPQIGTFSRGYNHAFAGVAQSVEQLIRNEKVGCSIHLSGTNTDKGLLLFNMQQTLFQ